MVQFPVIQVNGRRQAMSYMAARLVVLGTLALVVSACDKAGGTTKDSQAAAPAALLLSSEDLLTVASKTLASGPAITGSILPEKRADLRAEVSAIVLSVLKENGDPVKRGQLLVQLDDTSIRDTLASAHSAAETAAQAYDQAQRQYERMAKLREGGLVSAQAVEDAEVRRNSTQSDREAAKSRLVAAQQQQQRTMVRAPFDGIVSDRRVSAGDTAQVGKELVKVIDPASLRFEGFVSAESIGTVHPGQLVSFARGQQSPGVAGLYAEGRVETASKEGISLPASVIARDGDNAFAWKVQDGKLHKLPLQLGDRDPRRGEYVILSGLAAGDQVLRYPTTALHDGQAVHQSGK